MLQSSLASFREVFREPTWGLRFLLWVALSASALWPAFVHPSETNQFRDAQYHQLYEEVAVQSVRAGNLPLWNPYFCGGISSIGDPQSRFLAPNFLLSLLFGGIAAQVWSALLMMVIGAEGMFRYLRFSIGKSEDEHAWVSVLCTVPTVLLLHYARSYYFGWINFYGFLLIPWLLYFLDRILAVSGSLDDLVSRRISFRATVGFAWFAAWILGFGGSYSSPLAFLILTVHGVRRLLRPDFWQASGFARTTGGLVRQMLLLALLTLAACSIRLWPLLEEMVTSPRVMTGAPGHSVFGLWTLLTGPSPEGRFDENASGSFFVGVSFLVVACAAFLRARAWGTLSLAALFIWLSSGYAAEPVSAFRLLRDLPVFSVLRYPERFLFLATIFLAEAAALSVADWLDFSRDPNKRAAFRKLALLWSAASAAAILYSSFEQLGYYQLAVNAVQYGPRMSQSQDQDWPMEHFQQARGNRWSALEFPMLERGSLSCGEAYPVPMSLRLRGDLPKDEYLADASAGTVQRSRWTPNEIDLDVHLDRDGRVLVNQNYHRGWKSNHGTVVSEDGLLAIDLPAGDHRLELRHRPRSFVFGAITSLLALLASCLLVWASPSWFAAFLWTIAAPVFGIGLSFLIWHEPLPVRPAPTNPDGSPAVVETIPSAALPVGVQYEVPIELVAAERPLTDQHGVTTLAIYWRVNGPVSSSVSYTVLVPHADGTWTESVREVLSGSYVFARAPRGVLLRDLVPLRIAPNTAPSAAPSGGSLAMPRAVGVCEVRVAVMHRFWPHTAISVASHDAQTQRLDITGQEIVPINFCVP